jgi:hypothetical protein
MFAMLGDGQSFEHPQSRRPVLLLQPGGNRPPARTSDIPEALADPVCSSALV